VLQVRDSYDITNPTRHSPWKSNSPSASQAILCISWYLNVHYRVHNRKSLVPILSDNNAVHAHPTYLFKNNLILSSHLRLGLPSLLFPWGFPTTTTHAPLLSSKRATYSDHLILTYFITWIFGEQNRSQSFSLCNFLHSSVPSSPFGPNIFCSNHFQRQ
jgi:hypothetical protein